MAGELRKLSEETRRIIDCGHYERKGSRITLPLTRKEFGAVSEYGCCDVGQAVMELSEEMDWFDLETRPRRGLNCWEDRSALDAARNLRHPLVVTFADFAPGARTSLGSGLDSFASMCRRSTLSASVDTKKAAELYFEGNPGTYLFSPNVVVFRSQFGELLDEPFVVPVCTVPVSLLRNASCAAEDMLDRVLASVCEILAFRHDQSLVLDLASFSQIPCSPSDIGASLEYVLSDCNCAYGAARVVLAAAASSEEELAAMAPLLGDTVLEYELRVRMAKQPVLCEGERLPEQMEGPCGVTRGLLKDGTPFQAKIQGGRDDLSVRVTVPDDGFPSSSGKDEDRLTRLAMWLEEMRLARFAIEPVGLSMQRGEEGGRKVVRILFMLRKGGQLLAVTPLRFGDYLESWAEVMAQITGSCEEEEIEK